MSCRWRCFAGRRLTDFHCPRHCGFGTGSDAGAGVVVGTGAALEIFDCTGLLWGRIVWLRKARDTAGRPVQDDENPDPKFRRRPPCDLTILHWLRPAGRDHWNSGSLYNPDDGQTYRVSAKLRSPDVLVARIYVGVPLFGDPGARLGRALLALIEPGIIGTQCHSHSPGLHDWTSGARSPQRGLHVGSGQLVPSSIGSFRSYP
jgi:hypothetical protein